MSVDTSTLTAEVTVDVVRVTVDGETVHDERAGLSEDVDTVTKVTSMDGHAVTVEFVAEVDVPGCGGGCE